MSMTESPSRNETNQNGASKGADGVEERIHALETAQAVQVASAAGMEATHAATLAGMTTTAAATQAANMAVMAVGSVSLIVGMFLGLTITRSRS
jgi:hypothetical protein